MSAWSIWPRASSSGRTRPASSAKPDPRADRPCGNTPLPVLRPPEVVLAAAPPIEYGEVPVAGRVRTRGRRNRDVLECVGRGPARGQRDAVARRSGRRDVNRHRPAADGEDDAVAGRGLDEA